MPDLPPTTNVPPPTVVVSSPEQGAKVWDALRDPTVWSALAQLAASLGHTTAARRFPLFGVAFQLLSKLVGPHPANSGQAANPPE